MKNYLKFIAAVAFFSICFVSGQHAFAKKSAVAVNCPSGQETCEITSEGASIIGRCTCN